MNDKPPVLKPPVLRKKTTLRKLFFGSGLVAAFLFSAVGVLIVAYWIGFIDSTRDLASSTIDLGAALAEAKRRPAIPQILPSLPFRVVKREVQMKGGSLNPPVAPKYKMWVVNAIPTGDSPTITKESVSATLTELLRSAKTEAIQAGDIYGITVFLYQSAEHANGANGAIGSAEWWPKGHSFDPNNADNIENLATHEEHIQAFSPLPYAISSDSIVNRLPEGTRKEIFTELVKSQDRALKEAEDLFPTDATKIPIGKQRNYDFKAAFEKSTAEEARRQVVYEKELLGKYKITSSELKAIRSEAGAKNWPLPPTR